MNAHYTKTTGINVCGIDDDSYDLEEPLHIVQIGEVTIQKFESAPAWTVINGQLAPENIRTDFGNFEAAGYAMKAANGDVQAAIEKLREDGNLYDFEANAWQAVIDWLSHNNNGERCYHGEFLTEDCPYCAEETGMTLPMPRGERLVYAH